MRISTLAWGWRSEPIPGNPWYVDDNIWHQSNVARIEILNQYNIPDTEPDEAGNLTLICRYHSLNDRLKEDMGRNGYLMIELECKFDDGYACIRLDRCSITGKSSHTTKLKGRNDRRITISYQSKLDNLRPMTSRLLLYHQSKIHFTDQYREYIADMINGMPDQIDDRAVEDHLDLVIPQKGSHYSLPSFAFEHANNTIRISGHVGNCTSIERKHGAIWINDVPLSKEGVSEICRFMMESR